MIVTPYPPNHLIPLFHGPEPITGDSARSSDSRPHLTDILRDLAAAIGKGKDRDAISEEELNRYAAGGWIWEHAFDQALAAAVDNGQMWSPGEVECEGIVGTPDRLRIGDHGELRVQELKARWQSSRKFDDLERNYWIELAQIMSYCYMNSTRYADLHVFYVAGDWRPPVPVQRSAALEFTERELRENWDMVVGHAKRKGWLQG